MYGTGGRGVGRKGVLSAREGTMPRQGSALTETRCDDRTTTNATPLAPSSGP